MSQIKRDAIEFLRKTLLPGMLFSISACSSQQSVNFSVIQESNQCRELSSTIHLIPSTLDQTQIIKKLNRFSDDNKLEHVTQLFELHAHKERLLVVYQGQKPSAGYGFNIISSKGSLVNKTLTLPIKFTAPKPDTMQAQVLTSPCLVLGIDSKAQYDHLVIDGLELSISK